jgi:hypothetical protein
VNRTSARFVIGVPGGAATAAETNRAAQSALAALRAAAAAPIG